MAYRPQQKWMIWTRYKKWILIGAAGFMALFVITIGGIGFAVYQSASYVKENLSSLQIPDDMKVNADLGTLPGKGWTEDFVISIASMWLQQSLAEQDAAQLKAGLSCFDALGGPTPIEVVGYVKTQVTDVRVTKELDALAGTLQGSDSAHNGAAACASWMLNG